MFSSPRTTREGYQPTRSPKYLSLFLFVLTALIAGFVTPLMTTAPAQAAPVTQTIYVVYASRYDIPSTEDGKNSFLGKDYLDALVKKVSDYWHDETNGAIAKFTYDWNQVKTLQIPPDMPIWENTPAAADYYGLSSALFPGVNATGNTATQIWTLVDQAEGAGLFLGVSSGNDSTHSVTGAGKVRTLFYKPGQDGVTSDPDLWAAKHAWPITHEIGHNLGLYHAYDLICEGTYYDGNSERCKGSQPDTGDLMSPSTVINPYDPYSPSLPHISSFRRSELGLLGSKGSLSISDYYSSTETLTSALAMKFDELNEVRITDPSDSSIIYSIENRGAWVLVYRVVPMTGRPGAQTYLLQPTLASQGGAKGFHMMPGDSFTSASGNVTFSVVSIGDKAVINLNVASVLSVSTTTMVAVPDGHIPLVGLINSSMPWDATSSEWITISTPSYVGGTLEFYWCEPNLTGESRSGTITVTTSSGVSRTINVTQDPVVLNVSQSQWNVSQKGGSLPVTVTASSEWRVSIPPEASSWLTSDIQSGLDIRQITTYTMNLTAKANTTDQLRSTTVTLTQPVSGYSQTITVTQVPIDCGASISSSCSWSDLSKPISGMIDLGGDKDWYKFVAPSTGQWSFTSSIPASGGLSDSYGTLYDSKGTPIALNDDGAGNRQFLVKAILTERQTYYLEVRGYNSAYQGIFTVTAAKVPPTLTVDPGSLSVSANTGSSSVLVSSDTTWRASVRAQDSNWLTILPTTGSGNAAVNINYSGNSGGSRTGVVTFTTTAGEPAVSKTVSVTQAAADCGATTSLNCPWSNLSQSVTGVIDPGGDKDWYKFTAPSSGTWTFTSSVPASGGLYDPVGTLYASDGKTPIASNDDGAGNRQFSVKATLTQGLVYFLEVKGYSTAYTGTFTVTAEKLPPSLTLSPGSLSFAAGGGSSSVTVNSDSSWSVSVRSEDASWLSVTPTSGSGNGPVIVQARANTGAERTGVVTVVTTSGDPVKSQQISVTQMGQECGATTSGACPWSNVTIPISGMIDPGGDKDWYKFTVPSSGTWTFKASVPASGGLRDSYGTLYASDGKTVIAANDDGAGNLQFAVTASLVAKQTYYLEVKGWSTAYSGAFTVTATKG